VILPDCGSLNKNPEIDLYKNFKLVPFIFVIEVQSTAEAKRFFLQLLCPDQLWGPPSLLYNGHKGFFPRGYNAAGA
jgi:hypothetical protein